MTTSHGPQKRPYKVWSCDRQTRKAVVASTLRELKEKGCDKLGYSQQQLQEVHPMRLVLECDGTEVEEDTYFQTVAADTIFLLLRPSEKWLPPGVEALRAGSDCVDAAALTSKDGLPQVLNFLRADIANIILLSENQLELVANMDIEKEACNSSDSQLLRILKETSDRMCIEQQGFQEARQVLAHLKSYFPKLSIDEPDFPKKESCDRMGPDSSLQATIVEARQYLSVGRSSSKSPLTVHQRTSSRLKNKSHTYPSVTLKKRRTK